MAAPAEYTRERNRPTRAASMTCCNASAARRLQVLGVYAWCTLGGSGRRLASGSLLALALAGCAHYPVNARLDQYAPTQGYRLENLSAADNSGSLFVVLAFSGGATRAAEIGRA